MVKIIVATSKNRVIGNDNKLIWKLSSDLKRFKELTTGNPVVMGRKTFESLPAKLEDRINVVISSQETDLGADLQFKCLDDFLVTQKTDSEIFIIGGKGLIEEALSKYKNSIQNMYVSIS